MPAKPRADERESDWKHQEGRPSSDPEWGADERKARHAAGIVEGEGDGQERAQRVGDHIDGRELKPIHDVPQKRPTVVEQVDAAVLERIGQPVPRTVDCEHTVGLRESRENRHHLVSPPKPPWMYRSGAPVPSSKTCVSPSDQRIRRTRVSGANRASSAACVLSSSATSSVSMS